MTISLRAAGTLAIDSDGSGSGSTLVVSYPAGITTTDISILQVSAKPNSGVLPADMTCSVPAGWMLILEASSGNTPPGTPEGSSGSVKVWVYRKTGTADTGSFTVTLTNNSTGSAAINTYAGNGTGWNTSATYGYDYDLSGVNPYDSSRTVASINLSIATGDWMLVRSAFNSNAGMGTATVTATGATLSAATVRQSANAGVTIPDSSLTYFDARDVTVSSGTSTAGPKLATTTAQDGVSVFILIREGIRTISGAETATTVEKSTLGAQTDLPVTRDWVNGDPLDAATLNAAFRDPIGWLMTDSPGIQLRKTSEPNLTSTPYTVDWSPNTIDYRRGSMLVNATKITVPTTGIYVGEFQVGVKDIGTMNLGWLLTVDVLTYPGGTGTANVHNISTSFTDMDVEQSFTVGSIPFTLHLNQGDAIEVRMSGGWGIAGTALWATSDPLGVAVRLDLHWYSNWDGVSR